MDARTQAEARGDGREPGQRQGPATPLRVVIAGGGTGGHLYPGLAVAHEVVAQAPGAIVTFAGTARGIEARVIPREGFGLDLIRSSGLKGKSVAALARGMALLPASGLDAWTVISRRRPHVTVGVGGYSSGPVVLVAALRGRRTMVLEQNAVPGLANRRLAPFVDAAAVTYGETVRWFGAKAFVSGNPVRAGFSRVPDAPTDGPDAGRRVLVFGGSQGAHAINEAMTQAASALAAASPRIAVVHQTGERDLGAVRDAYGAAGLEARVAPFLEGMDREMAWADVIVCRAGATTLAEVTAAGRASVLIPLPGATDDHQRRNADALARAGAAIVIDQADVGGARLAKAVIDLLDDAPRRARIASAARGQAKPDAARLIAERVRALARTAGWEDRVEG